MRFKGRDAWWPATGAIAILLAIGVPTRSPADAAVTLPGAALALGACIALTWARGLGALALVAAAAAGVDLVAGSGANDLAWFSLCILVCASTLAFGTIPGLIVWGGTVLLLVANWAFVHDDAGWLPWIAGVSLSAVAAQLFAREGALLAELREAQVGLAERSRAEERNRISRDLHDVIAHSLTVSLLHISSARLALEHDPDDAARALAEAERLGRESLEEVRSIVGLMRSGGEGLDARLAPVPGLDAVDELVARFRGAGADVTIERDGDLEQVPATASSTIYRIAQEALTNAAKHAPGSSVRVRVGGGPGQVSLVVDSSGSAGPIGRGSGLSTMRERAEAVGGICEAGPCERGWRVRALLPARR